MEIRLKSAFCAWKLWQSKQGRKVPRGLFRKYLFDWALLFIPKSRLLWINLSSVNRPLQQNRPHPVPVESLPPAWATVIARLVKVLRKIWLVLCSVFSWCRIHFTESLDPHPLELFDSWRRMIPVPTLKLRCLPFARFIDSQRRRWNYVTLWNDTQSCSLQLKNSCPQMQMFRGPDGTDQEVTEQNERTKITNIFVSTGEVTSLLFYSLHARWDGSFSFVWECFSLKWLVWRPLSQWRLFVPYSSLFSPQAFLIFTPASSELATHLHSLSF